MVTAHAPCHVTYYRAKMIHIFEIPDPNLFYSSCHIPGATTRLSHMLYAKNSVVSLCRLQSLLRMRSIT